jgi:hypothetical protein
VFPLINIRAVPARRLEDKIRQPCALATAAKDDDAWLILSELRTLISQHIEHLRMIVAGKFSGKREFLERRSDGNPQELQEVAGLIIGSKKKSG